MMSFLKCCKTLDVLIPECMIPCDILKSSGVKMYSMELDTNLISKLCPDNIFYKTTDKHFFQLFDLLERMNFDTVDKNKVISIL